MKYTWTISHLTIPILQTMPTPWEQQKSSLPAAFFKSSQPSRDPSHNAWARRQRWKMPPAKINLEVWKISRGTWEYMGVSLNGGTPKPPQNDHFY